MQQTIWQFTNPWFLVLLPLPIFFLIWQIRRERKHSPAVIYSDLSVAKGLPVTLKQRFLGLMPWIRTLALILGILALARPQFGTIERDVNALGVDISLALDVSGSMRADDFYPTRLEAAKSAAIDFVENRETDRVSLVIFAETSALLCPPTLDMGAVEMFINAIQHEIIPDRATAVGMGLAQAVKLLEDSEIKEKVVILLTDGENNAGKISPEQAAEAAKALGVRVYTIGVGSNAISRFPGMSGRLMRQEVSMDDSTLRMIAESTGGKYYIATDEEKLKEIYEEIDRLEKTEIEVKETADFEERFMLFWIPGLALIGLEFLLRAFWLRRLP